jgi:hypothetical protein
VIVVFSTAISLIKRHKELTAAEDFINHECHPVEMLAEKSALLTKPYVVLVVETSLPVT